MKLHFYKYEGTGNDFVVIDNRNRLFARNREMISKLCDRRFGLGADGLMLLENDVAHDFRMAYFNSDGNEGSMCGNGGRCMVAFAQKMGIIDKHTTFMASDGLHSATIENDIVSLQMKDVTNVMISDSHMFLDTGSPHHIEIVEELTKMDVRTRGALIRYGALYGDAGSNVNFVQPQADGSFSMRTYERGVEDETLSCGTGATAVAIAMYASGRTALRDIQLNVAGGILRVSFEVWGNNYKHVFLQGPATFVYEGTIQI